MSFNSSLVRYTRITKSAFHNSPILDPSRALNTAAVGGERHKATAEVYCCRLWQLRGTLEVFRMVDILLPWQPCSHSDDEVHANPELI